MDTLAGRRLIAKDGSIKCVEDVLSKKIKTVVYYFSANWVEGHEKLLSTLVKVYKENKKLGTGWEIIFVSSDNSLNEFEAEFHSKKHGAWYAIPFEDIAAEELRYKYSITYLPNIIVVRKSGEIVSLNGREDLEAVGINVLVTWND